jgi:hypothetical protein
MSMRRSRSLFPTKCNTGAHAGMLAAAAVLGCSVSVATAQTGSVFVDARSNIFGYGISTPQPGGGGGGLAAVTIALSPGTGRVVTFNNTGSAWWTFNVPGSNGPDGGNLVSTTNIAPLGPISGFSAVRSGHLLGLFLDADDPTGQAAPANFAYAGPEGLTLTSYSPLLRQIFFVGDGLTGTGSGSTQQFFVPDSATRLVLGIADALGFAGPAGYYDDNTNGFNVSYSVIPSPSAAALLGLGGLLAARRRRR